MPRNADAYALYERIQNIPGWLNVVTAHRTIDLLAWQRSSGISGTLMEIGVFCGRYFSILVNDAIQNGDRVLGLDTFQYAPKERVEQEVYGVCGDKGVFTLWSGDSSRVTGPDITGEFGRPRFVSVDGAHDYENVYRDLLLAEQILSPDGIIAADDFLNPLAIGVNQAVNVFLSSPRSVVPVAYISNKLFLAHRSRADDYRNAIEESIMDAEDHESRNFREQLGHGRHHVEQYLWGHKILLS